uniref:Uncharacterized protein n=1 Tax=Picea sitchensis TaxID=3332 RepID=A9NU78_PICSI|nr:unknown [Picea sitchensis]
MKRWPVYGRNTGLLMLPNQIHAFQITTCQSIFRGCDAVHFIMLCVLLLLLSH